MKQPVERHLAAILAADMAGYSRLMGLDEAMELTRVVLPTPGPPVITSTLETRATRTASC